MSTPVFTLAYTHQNAEGAESHCKPDEADRVTVKVYDTASPHFNRWTFRLPEEQLALERMCSMLEGAHEAGKRERSKEILALLGGASA